MVTIFICHGIYMVLNQYHAIIMVHVQKIYNTIIHNNTLVLFISTGSLAWPSRKNISDVIRFVADYTSTAINTLYLYMSEHSDQN